MLLIWVNLYRCYNEVARHVANEIMHFWIKVEKVVRFKAQSTIDSKRKEVMDKHLDFMLGQTERYSTMLATKLTGEASAGGGAGGAGGGAAGAPPALPAPERASGGGASGSKPPSSCGGGGGGGRSEADEDEYRAADAEMEEEDDEATLVGRIQLSNAVDP